LDAPLGHNPSYTWRSLWSTQHLLTLGYRWKIGDGSKIKVWSMPWLRDLPSLKPSTPPPPTYEDLTVNHLMLPDISSWNHDLVHSLFNPDDAAAILSTPLYNRRSEDTFIWKATVDGSYSVKSAYRICIDLLSESLPLTTSTQWQLLWRLRVPPRVRTFLWRAAHHCLPTRDNLSKRGVPCSESCVSCDLLAESHMHIFFVCYKAMACWNLLGIGDIIQELLYSANSFQHMLFDLFSKLHDQQKQLAAMTLWSLWKSRNLLLWDDSDTTPILTITRAQDVLHEWSCVQKAKHPTHHDDQLPSWEKPPHGSIKCNVDAALLNGNSVMCYGLCFRDSSGNLLFGKSDFKLLSTTVLEAEAIGLLEALKMAISKGLCNVAFETDSKLLVDLLGNTNPPLNEIGDLVSECRTLLLSNPDYVVSFVRRQANRVAHNIARAALSNPSPHVFHDVPTSLYSLFMNEMQ
jgi:ribonuclease HI